MAASFLGQFQISYLTKAGFLVVIPNYRLCPQISAFERPITDSRDCLIWVKECTFIAAGRGCRRRVSSEYKEDGSHGTLRRRRTRTTGKGHMFDLILNEEDGEFDEEYLASF